MIAQSKPKGKETDTSLKDVWFYDKNGKLYPHEAYTANESNIIVAKTKDSSRYAKVEFYNDGKKRCYIKRIKGGRTGEVVVDPWSALGADVNMEATNHMYGGRMCEYFLVNENIFADYVDYLKTRNPARVRQVERAVLNGE